MIRTVKMLAMAAGLALTIGANAAVSTKPLTEPQDGSFMSVPTDQKNAALYYWRGFYMLDREFTQQSADLFKVERPASWVPDEATKAKLNENSSALAQVLGATRIPSSDFGIAYDEGYMAVIPHVFPMRAAARMFLMEARVLLAEGKAEDAAERIAAVYRMAAHLRSDRILISSLVGMAIVANANEEVKTLTEAGKLTPGARTTILGGLKALDRPDGFGVKGSMVMERHISVDYLRRFAKGPDAGKTIAAMWFPDGAEDQKQAVSALDAAGVNRDLDRASKFYDDLLAAWDQPDAMTRLGELSGRLERGEYGVMAMILIPALTNSRARAEAAQAGVSETMRLLRSDVK